MFQALFQKIERLLYLIGVFIGFCAVAIFVFAVIVAWAEDNQSQNSIKKKGVLATAVYETS